MPFIDLKITETLTEDKKTALKTKIGEKVSLLNKPESYLMVGIDAGYDLYFAGKKLQKGAFVQVSLFGRPASADCEKMTAAICSILKDELCIDGNSVYVAYSGTENWGWNGVNF